MNPNGLIICEVDNWEIFLSLAIRLQKDVSKGWFFRGQSDFSWPLSTSFERRFDSNRIKQRFVTESKYQTSSPHNMSKLAGHIFNKIHEIRLRAINSKDEYPLREIEWLCISEFRKDASRFVNLEFSKDYNKNDNIEWLSMMQHYGAPTRLLDFTESLYAALFFAFLEDHYSAVSATKPKAELKPKAVWAISKHPLFYNQEEIQQNYISKTATPEDNVDNYETDYMSDSYTRNLECLTLANKYLEKTIEEGIEGEKRDGVIPIIPFRNNERLSAQDGLFLFPKNLSSSFEVNLCNTLKISKDDYDKPITKSVDEIIKDRHIDAKIVKFVFNSVNCASADELLKSANISFKNLFPGLEGIARNINHKFF